VCDTAFVGAALAGDERRNRLVLDTAVQAIQERRPPIDPPMSMIDAEAQAIQ
jgi:hypothetical protein